MRHIARSIILPSGIAVLGCLAACDDARVPLVQDNAYAQRFIRANPDRGRTLIAEKGCIACHSVPQVHSPDSHVGPTLNHVRRQAYLSGVLPNTPANLVRWLMNPPAINPHTVMPNVGLRQDEAEDIAAFLVTLP